MTSQSPRIYTYKITFEEVPYYYYGVHKEKRFNEEYWGSPVTHKKYWELYTPKKEIIKTFDYTDSGWTEAQEFEKGLIKPVYNNDIFCLNESCGGNISLRILRETGKRSGKKTYKEGKGIFSLTKEEKREIGKRVGPRSYEMKTGIFSLTPEQQKENCKKGGKIGGKTSGNNHLKNNTGIFSLTPEQQKQRNKNGGKKSTSQVWECTITGHRSNAGGLSTYQKARGIDTSNRIRI